MGAGVGKPAFSPVNRNVAFATIHAPQQQLFGDTAQTATSLSSVHMTLRFHSTARARKAALTCDFLCPRSLKLMFAKLTLEGTENTALEPSMAWGSDAVRVLGAGGGRAGHPAQFTHLSRRVSCATVRQPQSKNHLTPRRSPLPR